MRRRRLGGHRGTRSPPVGLRWVCPKAAALTAMRLRGKRGVKLRVFIIIMGILF